MGSSPGVGGGVWRWDYVGSHHTFCRDVFRAVPSVGFDISHVDPFAEKGKNDLKCHIWLLLSSEAFVGAGWALPGLSAGWKSQNSFSSSKWRREKSALTCW